jgi:RNA polymerase sigma-70 factor (ECF subfamily)
MIVAAAEQLPDLYRTVLNLYYWLDCSVEEIGVLIGAPTGTVKSYLSRARDRMRFELKKKGIENV